MKMLKKILTSGLIICGFCFSHYSCTEDFLIGDKFLEKPPSVDVTIDSVFAQADNARGFLWGAYSTLYYGLNWDWSSRGNKMNMGLQESLGDDFHSYLSWDNVNRIYYTGLYNASMENNQSAYDFSDGETQWTGIRKAWIFIENVDRVPDMDNAEKSRLKGEARLIIACHYTDMFRHFGGLPLVQGSIKLEDGKNYIPRATARETVQFITDLCDSAYQALPWALSTDEAAKWDGRLTGASALGLKIRALLFAASPLFNDDQPYYTEKQSEANTKLYTWMGKKDMSLWTDLEAACKEFMNQLSSKGGYELVTNSKPGLGFRYGYFNRGTKETLISTRIRETIPGNVWDGSYYFLQSATYYGSLNPTLDYIDSFSMADGTPFDASIWGDTISGGYYFDNGVNPFAGRDPRLSETCLVNGVNTIQDRPAELWIGGRERSTSNHDGGVGTGAGLFKFLLTGQLMSNTEAHWPYLRLAEIYLTYAEVINELYGPTNEAFFYLNKTRLRVNLKGLKEANPTTVWDHDNFLNAVLNERACEFGVEEVRLFDMTRRKLEQDFRKRLHGVDIYQYKDENDKVVPGKYIYKRYTIAKRYLQDGDDGTVYFSPKWYLSAFPLKEVNKGYLTQNPGWE